MSGKTVRSVFVFFLVGGLLLALFVESRPALGAPAIQTPAPWNGNFHTYAAGDLVTYNGNIYRCIQGHTSQPGWDPVSVPALWAFVGPAGATATPTRTRTPGGATATPTRTLTRTNTPVGPTNTPTRTRTPTVIGPTATTTRTATRTPTSTNCSGLPRHVLTGYWQNFTNGATPLRLRDVPSSYNLIAVAFAEATGTPGAVTFSIDPGLSSALGGYTNADFINDIRTLHNQCRKVIISVGGERGTVSVGDATAAANFANSVHSLMTQYGFDGVDIDLENGLSATHMTSALRQLSSRVGSSLIITLAPQTIDMQSTGMSYFQLALNIQNILTIVNMQYYNSGAMLGCDQMFAYNQGTLNFLTALACIQLQNGLRPDQVGLGLPASPSAAGGGYLNPAVVNAALDCLAAGTNCGSFRPPRTWPGIRGAMTWSINWDASNGYNFANTVSSHFPAVP